MKQRKGKPLWAVLDDSGDVILFSSRPKVIPCNCTDPGCSRNTVKGKRLWFVCREEFTRFYGITLEPWEAVRVALNPEILKVVSPPPARQPEA